MTVLVREELNEADLAWAAADQLVANVMAGALRIQAMQGAGAPAGSHAQELPFPAPRPVAMAAAGRP